MAEDTSTAGKSLVGSSFSSLSFLVALQLFSRLFTSVLNQALFRLASPSVFGTAAIQFELILSTILFLSREGVRNAILRTNVEAGEEDKVKATNLTFLPILLGVPLALLTSLGYVASASEEVRRQPHLVLAVGMYALAALVELLSEPMHNMAMVQLKTDVRVRAEGLGITCKSVVTFFVLLYDVRYGDNSLPLVAFAAGQLTYGVIVFLSYARKLGIPWFRASSSQKKVPAETSTSKFQFDAKLLRLSLIMTSQSVIKHFLTEGDKLVLSFFSPLQDQGGYAIAVNYGSLIARIVFQPIEETLRIFFSKLLSPSASKTTKKEALTQSSNALLGLISAQLAFSMVLTVFGSAYLPIVLPILLPQRYLATSAPKILSAWIYYIPVLALNGGLEAFLSSVASEKDLNRQSRWMIFFSVVYVSATILFYRLGLGDASLIYANILNLSARIGYCIHFASQFFAKSSPPVRLNWKAALPPPLFIVLAAISSLLVRFSRYRLGIDNALRSSGRTAIFLPRTLAHIGFGGALALACVGVWWITQGRSLVSRIRHAKVD
ncbi:Rft-1-domain-containing protein [Coprinopsis marcescibilis]|uniref:Man(5)GlcNAc(2)-PP-dolichol translocation protein RFT1 n=1 Tax=Coprinopsis marcescibilis TaxID=230819 RepID=A0A5C3KJR8_COPMA|nr:Rft-1-domain-containing protein [Coprinopsis marcescibilis]